MKRLHLGCGLEYKEGWINLDFNEKLKIDVSHDLEKFPYPFEDNTFDEIFTENTLEHLKDVVKVMEELHRISKPNARTEIIVPHYSGCMAFSHLTHKSFFGSGTFSNFEKDSWEKYSEVEFKILKNKLIWLRCRNWFWIRPCKYIINKIININQFISERFLCYPLGGFDHIQFILEVKKDE